MPGYIPLRIVATSHVYTYANMVPLDRDRSRYAGEDQHLKRSFQADPYDIRMAENGSISYILVTIIRLLPNSAEAEERVENRIQTEYCTLAQILFMSTTLCCMWVLITE